MQKNDTFYHRPIAGQGFQENARNAVRLRLILKAFMNLLDNRFGTKEHDECHSSILGASQTLRHCEEDLRVREEAEDRDMPPSRQPS